MKQICTITSMVIGLYSCDQTTNTGTKNKMEIVRPNFDWLTGNWIRTNEQEGKSTFENWEKKSDSAYNGFSYTMQNSDTVWQEHVRLIKTNNNWSFDVTQKGQTEPTTFKLTNIEKNRFICENQANDFPKKIEYSVAGTQLNANISGPNMEVLFEFKKME